MTLWGEGTLPDFNPLLTREVMTVQRQKYEAALSQESKLFELCAAMGLFDSVDADGRADAQNVLNGLPPAFNTEVRTSLHEALTADPPFGIFIVYVLTGGDLTIERAKWPNDSPRVLVVRGPHP